jgi:hypothetical protein
LKKTNLAQESAKEIGNHAGKFPGFLFPDFFASRDDFPAAFQSGARATDSNHV